LGATATSAALHTSLEKISLEAWNFPGRLAEGQVGDSHTRRVVVETKEDKLDYTACDSQRMDRFDTESR
jgi:hypothetical protein